MPGGDGTGPWWSLGRWNCRRGFGRGMGIGFGRRGGFGRGFGAGYQVAAPLSREDDLSELKSYANELKAELEAVKKRIASLGKRD